MPLMPDGWSFDKERHIDRDPFGREYISVTTALKEGGVADFFKYPDRAFFAMWRGTVVHDALEKVLKAKIELPEIERMFQVLKNVDGHGYLAAFLKCRREISFEVAFSDDGLPLVERKIVDLLRGYAGRFDVAAYVNGVLSMIDFKTGAPLHYHGVQLAGYCHGLWGSLDNVKRYGLYLHKDGTYKLKPFIDDEEDLSVFFSAVTIAQWKRKHAA